MMMMENNINNNNNNISRITSSLFAVTFFDGERELDMGTVQITPSLTFKSFQSILSQKLQISPHQITIYFERQQTPLNHHHHHHHHRRRHPVTSKFDFGSIMSDSTTSFFWVVQKRSRRTRRRKPKNSPNNNNNNNNNNNIMLLRRDYNELEYLRMLQIERQRERYLMSLNLNSNVYDDLSCFYNGGGGGGGGGFGGGGGGGGYNGNFSDDGASSSGGGSSIDYSRVIGFCDVCFNYALNLGETTTTNNTVPFHCCKNDAVTQVYKSPAGPIGPPNKKKN